MIKRIKGWTERWIPILSYLGFLLAAIVVKTVVEEVGINPFTVLLIIIFAALVLAAIFWLSGLAVKEAKEERKRLERRGKIGGFSKTWKFPNNWREE